MAILLRHEEIAGLVSMGDAIEAIRHGMNEQAAGHAQVPNRLTVDSSAGWLRTMPVVLNGSGYMGYKVMHSTNGVGVAYLIALYNLRSGELLAMMDADWITQFRTAATTAVGTDCLARSEVRTVGMLGTGEQAKAHVEAMLCVRKFNKLKVYSPRPESRRAFAEAIARQCDVTVEPVEHPEDAVKGMDLVVSAFRATDQPVICGEWLTPGMHVSAISSVRSVAREVDDEVWRRSDVTVVDDRAHVLESGDGRSLLRSGCKDPADWLELYEAVGRGSSVRTSGEQITLFKSVGNALQDLVLAIAVYRRAVEQGLGTPLGDFPRIRKA